MQFITISEFARRENCSRTLVQRALKSGHLTAQADGKLDAKLVGTGWRKTNRAAHQVAGAGNPAKVAERILTVQGAPWSQAEAERVKENFLAKLRQIEFEQRASELITADEAEAVYGVVVSSTRSAFLSLPTRAAPLLAGKTSIAEIKAILEDLVHQALHDISTTEVVIEHGRLSLRREPKSRPSQRRRPGARH